MYDAPAGDTPEQLDALIPLGLSHWHAHTNICLPKGVTEADVINGNVGDHDAAGYFVGSMLRDEFGRSTGAGDEVRMRVGYLADPRFGFRARFQIRPTARRRAEHFTSRFSAG